MRCQNCNMGEMTEVSVKSINESIFMCDECSALCKNYDDLVNFRIRNCDQYLKENNISWNDLAFPLSLGQSINAEIHNAAFCEDIEKLKELINQNIDINIKNSYDLTVLHILSAKKNIDTVLFLLEKGADINSIDNTGETPLFSAVMYGTVEIVKLLLERGSDINFRNIYGQTPLHVAAHLGASKIPLLLQFKANVLIVDNCNETPLDYAKRWNPVPRLQHERNIIFEMLEKQYR
jgi:ankyrin repeat protein